MRVKTLQRSRPDAAGDVARENRDRLQGHGVFTVNIIGGAGSGKTSLIRGTLKGLAFGTRTGVITADPDLHSNSDLLAGLAHQFGRIDTGQDYSLSAIDVGDALDDLELSELDLLLIENVSSLVGPPRRDLGETLRVAVFSVAAGDDQLRNHRDAIRWAEVLVLNKIDLLASIPFDLADFRETVRRVNPGATLFELSVQSGEGIEAWLSLLNRESRRDRET